MLLHCGGTSWVANATILGEPLINQPGLMKIRCWHHMTNHDWKIEVMKWWYQCWLRVPCSIHRVTKRKCSRVDDFVWPCHLHLRCLLMLFLTIYHNRHKTHHIHSYTDCIWLYMYMHMHDRHMFICTCFFLEMINLLLLFCSLSDVENVTREIVGSLRGWTLQHPTTSTWWMCWFTRKSIKLFVVSKIYNVSVCHPYFQVCELWESTKIVPDSGQAHNDQK